MPSIYALPHHPNMNYRNIQICITTTPTYVLLQHTNMYYCKIQICITAKSKYVLPRNPITYYSNIQICNTAKPNTNIVPVFVLVFGSACRFMKWGQLGGQSGSRPVGRWPDWNFQSGSRAQPLPDGSLPVHPALVCSELHWFIDTCHINVLNTIMEASGVTGISGNSANSA